MNATLEKAFEGERITDEEAVDLLRSRDLVSVGRVANEIRNRKHDPERITFIIDRNLNYTNICYTDCDFCAFYRSPGDMREGYLLPKPVIFKKIEETLAIGGTGLLMQGGHHPDLGIDYYEDLFRSIKARYDIHLHALSPSEVQHIARRSKLTIPETLTRLRDAGLDSIPGGGAEVLVDRVRKIIAPKKTKSSEWISVMRHAHRLGISTTATMMYGHVKTLEERVEHMRRIRDLQDETGGFRAFFSWTFQDDGNRLGDKVPPDTRPTSFDYLLTQAVSRIYLDNVPHIGSSWVTQGKKIGQVALQFGADDLGSVMIEENVVSAAGTTHRTTADEFVHLIRSLGKTPVQRDTLYRDVRVWNCIAALAAEVHSATKQPLAREQARALLREAGIVADDLVELRDGEFTVCYATDDVVLKVWPEPGTPLLAYEDGLVHAEAELCRRARESGVPAPELVHVDTSRRIVDRDWLVMTRLPGTPLHRAGDADIDVERALGEAVARLHRVTGTTFGYVGRPSLQAATWRDAFSRIFAAVLDDAMRYEARLPFPVADARAALDSAAPSLDDVTVPVLVHFDLWAGNVLVDGGRLSGIIDGERSLYADPLAEWPTLAFGREPADRPELLAGYGGLDLDAAARTRLDLYRLYLCLIVLVEEVPRRYDSAQRAPLRARVEESALAAVARLTGR